MEQLVQADSTKEEGELTTSHVARNMFCVVVCVIILETLLHRLRHRLRHNKKYFELLNKVTTEFMVVGLIYLVIKALMYVKIIPYGGLKYKSLDAADILLFLVAIALVLQSLAIILALRLFNREMDTLELVTTGELVDQVKNAKSSRFWCLSQFQHRKRMQIRLLATFFRKVHGLPRLFSFAKYIREIQEHQIVELLEIDFTTWLLLLALFCGFFFCTGEMVSIWDHPHNSLYYVVKNPSGNVSPAQLDTYETRVELQNNRVVIMGILVAILFCTMILYWLYLNSILAILCNRAKLDAVNGMSPAPTELEALENLATEEYKNIEPNVQLAIAQMQEIGTQIEDSEDGHGHHYQVNLLVQLLMSAWRKCFGKSHTKHNALSAKIDDIHLPMFSRKACEFLIQFLLIVNGMYIAMLFASIFPTLQKVEVPAMIIVGILLAINSIIVAPRLIRAFSLVNGIYRVEAHTLGTVILHIAEAEKQKDLILTNFTQHCQRTHQSPQDLRQALLAVDATDAAKHDRHVDVESLRRVLGKFGCKMTRHQFHAFVRIMEFSTVDGTISIDDVLAIFPSPNDAAQPDSSNLTVLSI